MSSWTDADFDLGETELDDSADTTDTVVESDTVETVEVDAPELDAVEDDANEAWTFDPTLHGEATAKVVIDGTETEVSLKEALAGYQRQADYTRKTQELATMRNEYEQLSRAFQHNPQATIEWLAAQYNVKVGPQAETDEWTDTEDSRIQALERRFEQQTHEMETERSRLALEREAASLAQRYEDFDPSTVAQYALDNNLPTLDIAYRAWAYEAQAERLATLQAAQAKAEADAKTVAAKKKAAVVAGAGRQTTGKSNERYDSLDDAIAAAMNEVGWSV